MANFSDIVSPVTIGTVNIGGGSNVTLTTAQTNSGTLLLTGALTANVIVYFPARLKIWSVVNNTTGAFTVTLAMTGGLATLLISQGYSREFFSDGTTGVYLLSSDISNSILNSADINGGTLDGVAIGSSVRSTILATTIGASGQIISTLPTGTAPIVVASTTNVPNLNASSLNGATFAAPGSIGSTTASAGSFTTISASGIVTSTVVTGTAPLVVASTTNIPNLNASSLNGATFAAPGSIGSTTAGSGAFTNISASGQITSTVVTGTAPLVIASTTNVPNLNASSLNGATFAAPGGIGSTTAGSGAFTTGTFTTSILPTTDAAVPLGSTTLRMLHTYQKGIAVNAGTIVATPTTGTTVTVAQTTNLQAIDPAASLAALTVQFPTPLGDGHTFEMTISQSISTLTLTPSTGATIKGGFTTVSGYSATKWRYSLSNTAWYALNPVMVPTGPIITAGQVVTAATTLTAASPYKTIVNSASALTITLPTGPTSGTTFMIKNIGAGSVTVSGSVNIDGSATLVLAQWEATIISYNSTANIWIIE